ncbi:2-dehydropantoate 2-reductase [Kistimonas scapharcae]
MTSRIAIFGAGSIGCFIGGKLLAAGNEVIFYGRPDLQIAVQTSGLRLTELEGNETLIPAEQITFSTDPAILSDADLILVTVKSRDTETAGRTIRDHCSHYPSVISLQNGIENTAILRRLLPGYKVTGGMVPFNILRMEQTVFHRGTEGTLILQESPETLPLQQALERAGLTTETHRDISSILWGKLLLNLNNAINALSGLPLRQQLAQQAYRRVLATCIRETLTVLRVANIRPAKTGKVIPNLLPLILTLPDPLFIKVAGAMLKMDDNARSSMWEDLQRGREPEVDYINGAVIRLGEKIGVATPANQTITRLMRAAHANGKGSPSLSAEKLQNYFN